VRPLWYTNDHLLQANTWYFGRPSLYVNGCRRRIEPKAKDSNQYKASDTRHTGNPSTTQIRYAYTSDFKTFSPPQALINKSPTNIIDLTILPMPDSNGTSYLRFMKDESLKTVFVESTTTGLLGTWTRPGGASATIQGKGVEGPAAFWDNEKPGKAHLLLDFYNDDGYRPFESMDPDSNGGWKASDRGGFPKNLRHGSVMPINATLYAALSAKWG